MPDEATGSEEGTAQGADPATAPDQTTAEPPDGGATA